MRDAIADNENDGAVKLWHHISILPLLIAPHESIQPRVELARSYKSLLAKKRGNIDSNPPAVARQWDDRYARVD